MKAPPQNPAGLDGQRYLYNIDRHKGLIIGLQVGIALRDTARFTLRRESDLDRLAKWVGLAREWQTADTDFDERVYIQSEDSRLHDALTLDARLRAGVRALLQINTVSGVEMSKGVLWIRSSHDREAYGGNSDAEIAEKLARLALPQLRTAGARIVEIAAPWESSRDPYLQRYHAFMWVAIALGIGGLLSLIAKPGPELPHALMRTHIHEHATQAAAIAAGLLLVVVLAVMGRASRTHRLAACMLFIAVPGLWCAASVYFERMNNKGESRAAAFKTYVVDLREYKGKHRSYWADFALMPDIRISRSLKVDHGTYATLREGTCAYLDVRTGVLGDPWLAGIRSEECDASN